MFNSNYEGDVYGVEIELEATNHFPNIDSPWTPVDDRSLRGNAIECILREPLPLEEAKQAVISLYKKMEDYETDLLETGRAGVHVHINMGGRSWKDLKNLIKKYYICEKAILEFCGEERIGNYYCVTADDGNSILPSLGLLLTRKTKKMLRELFGDNTRYRSLNISSINAHGSLELRCMRSSATPEPIVEFLDIVDRLVQCPVTPCVNSVEEIVAYVMGRTGSHQECLQGTKNLLELEGYMQAVSSGCEVFGGDSGNMTLSTGDIYENPSLLYGV